jgi:signal transduction histidine kinase/HD-like signal output (HDOD) protein
MASTLLNDSHSSERLLAQIAGLGALGPAGAKLVAAGGGSGDRAVGVFDLIEADPGLLGGVLAAGQRALSNRQVSSIGQAATALGAEGFEAGVLVLSAQRALGAAVGGFDWTGFWAHGAAVGYASKLLSEACAADTNDVYPNAMLRCGVFHDIGKAAIAAVAPKSYGRVVRQAGASFGDICTIEQHILGIDHTIAGKRLAQRWGLSEALTACVWLHHQSPAALTGHVEHGRAVRLVVLADMLVRELEIGFSGNATRGASSESVAAGMGITGEKLRGVRSATRDWAERFVESIGPGLSTTGAGVEARGPSGTLRAESEATASAVSANERLRIQARYFDALAMLERERGLDDGVAGGCRAAAVAVKRALQVEAAVVYCVGDSRRGGRVALADASGTISEIESMKFDEAVNPLGGEAAMGAKPTANRLFVPADGLATSVVRRWRDRLGTGPLWTMALFDRGQWVGSAIVGAAASEIAGRHAESAELETLAAGMGQVLGSALRQAGVSRTAEQLAAANRMLTSVQQQLVRSKSLETVADMAAGAAHEMNNPLAVVSGRSQLLMNQVENEDFRASLGVIHKQAHRCSEIVNDLMAFAKPVSPKPRRIDLAGLLGRLRDSWLGTYRLKTDQITVELSDASPTVYADEGQLVEALGEVVSNAMDAMDPHRAKLIVNCSGELTDDTRTVEVCDNGIGMNREVQERAFAPFFSHRPAGRRRGLGLSRALRLVEINRGEVHLDSRPDGGTRVIFRLPTHPHV